MIAACFTRIDDRLSAFSLSGHAGFAQAGKDVVCASVTSAVQLTANTITEILAVKADVKVFENEICLALPEQCCAAAHQLLEGLLLHLNLLSEDYPGTIRLTVSEVS